MGKDPTVTMQKHGNNPAFKELLLEFSALMGNHFTDVGKQQEEEKKKEEEQKRKEMENDPILQKINTDKEVKAALEDPKVQQVIHQI